MNIITAGTRKIVIPNFGPAAPARPRGGGAAARTYAQILVEDYGAAEVWPLVNIASGVTIPAYVNGARDGTIGGTGVSPHWDLQNAAGPVPDSLAPYSDGANDYGDVYSASLSSIFDGNEGSIFLWANPEAGALSDGINRNLFIFYADGANYILLRNTASADTWAYQHEAGDVLKNATVASAVSGWASFALTWSKSGDEFKFFVNKVQTGATLTGLGTFAGVLNSNLSLIGANGKTNLVWKGHLAYAAFKFGGIWTPTQIGEMHDAAATAATDP